MTELIKKYNTGTATPEEIRLLEQLMEEGKMDLAELRDLNQLNERLMNLEDPAHSRQLDDRFYTMLAVEKRKLNTPPVSWAWPDWQRLFPQLAFACVLVLLGFGVGYWRSFSGGNEQVKTLTDEVSSLREMVMLSLLEKESTTERLKAVSLTGEMGQVSQKVTHALFKTLNEDDNVNVRLAALEALAPFAKDNRVREELVRSISLQDSPMVQVELAALMVKLQERKSVTELRKILQNERTPKEVKTRIEKSIDVLI